MAAHLRIYSTLRTQPWKTGYHFTIGNYLRLRLPEIIPENQVLYLDSDTLIISPIDDLFLTDLTTNVLAGVLDPVGVGSSRVPRAPLDPYLNTGVLLMNLDQLRKDQFIDKCIDLYQRYENDIVWVDQCLINKYAEGKKLVLSEQWNYQIFSNSIDQRIFDAITLDGSAAILHFVGDVKPWQERCNPMVAKIWQSYATQLDACWQPLKEA